LPTVLDRGQVDAWYKSIDRESFQMARKLISREGFLCGGSSGSAMYCAIEAIKKYNIGEGQNVVVLLPDSIRNYM
jgi:cystathionine beta-synthase